MVISAEPLPPPPPDPDAAAVEAVAAAATSNARQAAAFSSFPSLKTWGSHRALRYAHVNRAGDATTMRSPGKLAVVEEKAALSHLREVEAGRSDAADADADHVAAAAEEAAPALPPWKLRTRRRPKPKVATPSASMSPPHRTSGGHRARFSVTLTSEEIEEDIYAVTGARPRRCPRRRPRLVQKQLDMLFPGSWLSEVTVETCRVPDDRWEDETASPARQASTVEP
ncbi:hypothetical protein BDA96_02G036600 [Sorghum bicolor]|uniref:DUF1639 family protein n=2 Tax=Sorghum bicolor TaxID=4558 RepID=A0A921RK56_SORBI|nr:hypothetical protein BDA96_02G036600 [Sorghum bicolor]KXG34416.1 hypothetical protein SORBI_3002G036200 [Sorghum bicolor]